MRGLFEKEWTKLAVYFLGTLVLGSLLAPPLYHGCMALVRAGWLDNPGGHFFHSALERSPFSRYFNRSVMIVALLGLYPTIRWLRLQGMRDWKIEKNPCRVQDLLAGFLLACGLLLFMGASFLYRDFFFPDPDADWGVLPELMASAIVIGILEEFFFRGALLGLLMRNMRLWSAVVVTTLIYAVLHFIKAPKKLVTSEADVHWLAGFEMLAAAFGRFAEMNLVMAEFLTLVMVGGVLALARLRTQSLWLPIGLHAGWVFGLKFFNEATERGELLERSMPWVGRDLKTGIIALAVILITGVFTILWINLSRKLSSETDTRSLP